MKWLLIDITQHGHAPNSLLSANDDSVSRTWWLRHAVAQRNKINVDFKLDVSE
jgi:hypothetical protein